MDRPCQGVVSWAQDQGRDAGFVVRLPRTGRAQREIPPGLINLQGQRHVMRKAGKGEPRARRALSGSWFAHTRKEEVRPGAHKDQQDSLSLLAQALGAAQRVKKGWKLVLREPKIVQEKEDLTEKDRRFSRRWMDHHPEGKCFPYSPQLMEDKWAELRSHSYPREYVTWRSM